MANLVINCSLSEKTLTCSPGKGGVRLHFKSLGMPGIAPRQVDFLLSYHDAEQLSRLLAENRDIETCVPWSGSKMLTFSYFIQDCIECLCFEDPDNDSDNDAFAFTIGREDQGLLAKYLEQSVVDEVQRGNVNKGAKPAFGL